MLLQVKRFGQRRGLIARVMLSPIGDMDVLLLLRDPSCEAAIRHSLVSILHL